MTLSSDFHQILTFEITRPLCIAAAATCKLTISAATTHADFYRYYYLLFIIQYYNPFQRHDKAGHHIIKLVIISGVH